MSTIALSPAPHTPLWTGVIHTTSKHFALNGVARRIIPLRSNRGRCEIRGQKATLWFFTAETLGFDIVRARFPASSFVESMKQLYPATKYIAPGRARKFDGKIDVIFCHKSTLQERTSAYWESWKVPHIFDGDIHHQVQPPKGWCLDCLTCTHSAFGRGASDGIYKMGILLPCDRCITGQWKVNLPPQPWIPFDTYIDSCVSAREAVEPEHIDLQEAEVLWNKLEMLPYGLFPTQSLSARA